MVELPTDKYFKIKDAILHISKVKRGFVKNLRDEFAIGDIIRARVVGVSKLAVYLSTQGEEFGIVKGFCRKCRKSMEYINNVLFCRRCRISELRKVAKGFYGVYEHAKAGSTKKE